MAREAGAEHRAGGHVQGREQRRGPVAAVVVGAPLRDARTHRQHRLAALQRLYLRLLVHAQHHRSLRRMQVQPHDVAYLLDEQRIARQLEGLVAMWLETERAPDAAHRRWTQPTRLGHRPRAPMRGVCGDRLQGMHDHALHVVVPDRAWRSGARLVQQAVAAVAQEPPPPLADRRAGRAQFGGYLHVALAVCGLQHDPRPQDQRLSCLGPSHPALQFLPLSLRQIGNLSRVMIRHRRSPPRVRQRYDPLIYWSMTLATGH